MLARARHHGPWIALWLAFVAVLGGLEISSRAEDRHITARATASTTARVVDEHRGRRSWVVLEYRVGLRLFQKEFGAANLRDLRVGDELVVKYDPADPVVAILPASRPNPGLLGELLLVLGAPTLFVLGFRHSWPRDEVGGRRRPDRPGSD